MNNKNIAIILASGTGSRMNSNIPKQYLKLNNKPILYHTIKVFDDCSIIDDIIVVINEKQKHLFENEITNKYKFLKQLKIVFGGKERLFSVYNALKTIKNSCKNVIVHDGVRPFIKTEDIEKAIKICNKIGACVLGVPVKETIKICNNNNILSTPKRTSLWIAQTPQVFDMKILKKAYENAIKNNLTATDDSQIVEKIGHTVYMLEGSYKNIKITTQEDLLFAKQILNYH